MGVTTLLKQQSVEFDHLFYSYWDFMSKASRNSKYFYENLPTIDFIKFVSLRNHKSRGSDIENRIRHKNNWEKINRSEELGDAKDNELKYVEIKSSIVTPNEGSEVTLRGFRTWENVDYYLVVILDISKHNNQLNHYIYRLPKSFISEDNGFIPDNQNKNTRSQNKKVQIGINFKIGDSTFLSWEKFKDNSINF